MARRAAENRPLGAIQHGALVGTGGGTLVLLVLLWCYSFCRMLQ